MNAIRTVIHFWMARIRRWCNPAPDSKPVDAMERSLPMRLGDK